MAAFDVITEATNSSQAPAIRTGHTTPWVVMETQRSQFWSDRRASKGSLMHKESGLLAVIGTEMEANGASGLSVPEWQKQCRDTKFVADITTQANAVLHPAPTAPAPTPALTPQEQAQKAQQYGLPEGRSEQPQHRLQAVGHHNRGCTTMGQPKGWPFVFKVLTDLYVRPESPSLRCRGHTNRRQVLLPHYPRRSSCAVHRKDSLGGCKRSPAHVVRLCVLHCPS